MTLNRKLIFVIPWYGEFATGGAEMQCKTLVEHLNLHGLKVEVFTTCSKQFHSGWVNDFKPGIYDENGIIVKRFKIDERNTDLFNHLNQQILSSLHLTEKEELDFFKNSINSSDMMNEIKRDSDSLFIFIPYLYGTTFFGCQIHPGRSIMIPCLHDEGYAKMKLIQKAISKIKALSFNSVSEKDLALSLLGKLPYNQVLGEGIEKDYDTTDPLHFKAKYDLSEFILCAGRKEDGKNVPLLVDYFCRFLERNNTNLKLVLTGSGKIEIPSEYSHYILDLFLSKQELNDAYSAATLLCLPSVNESFSRVIMESWLNMTPVLVHNQCDVTKDFCVLSNGGLYFSNYDEFEACVKFYLDNPELRKKLGENGNNFVQYNFNWNKIISSYIEFFNTICN